MVTTPLSVCSALNEPQSLEPQLAFQFTPFVSTSFVIVALTFVVPPTAREEDAVDTETEMGRFTIVIVTLDRCDESLVTRDVIVTVLSAGITPGAV
jgi:hypothetical protein